MKTIIVLLFFTLSSAYKTDLVDVANWVNKIQSKHPELATWKSQVNMNQTKFYDFSKLLGVTGNRKLKISENKLTYVSIPDTFDGREKWNFCESISEIRDQSQCGSCWAFATVEVGTDRICIATNGTHKPHLSATDLMSCCMECGNGCEGGNPDIATDYLRTDGVVTGGNYNDYTWCQSYPFVICDHHIINGSHPPCDQFEFTTPKCQRKCDANTNYTTDYKNDKYKFADAYSLSDEIPEIQKEIMTYGSVVATLSVYEDFLTYKSGMYQHITGKFLGYHAVKVIGWGENYWICSNSWNNDFGMNGFFNIKFGQCGIEYNMSTVKYL